MDTRNSEEPPSLPLPLCCKHTAASCVGSSLALSSLHLVQPQVAPASSGQCANGCANRETSQFDPEENRPTASQRCLHLIWKGVVLMTCGGTDERSLRSRTREPQDGVGTYISTMVLHIDQVHRMHLRMCIKQPAVQRCFPIHGRPSEQTNRGAWERSKARSPGSLRRLLGKRLTGEVQDEC